jgi:hypothetical protein
VSERPASLDSFERYVQPHVRIIRLGRMRLVALAELEDWARAAGELGKRLDRLDRLDTRLDRIESTVLRDHGERIARLEERTGP